MKATVSNYGYITIPSKMNDLEEWEVSFLFPTQKNIPLFPDGISKYNNGKYRVRKQVNGKDYSIGLYKDLSKAITSLSDFCIKHKLKLF